MIRQDHRPKFLNLLRISMPAGAVASIAHRFSGLLLFLAIPVFSFLLYQALAGPEPFAQVRQVMLHPGARILSVILVWALAHHFLAGIRFLLLDLHVGVDRGSARGSAWLVSLLGVLVALLYLLRVAM